MKDQDQNKTELKNLKVDIEAKVFEDLKLMSKNSGISIDDLVVIALKRFRSSHADFMGIDLDYP